MAVKAERVLTNASRHLQYSVGCLSVLLLLCLCPSVSFRVV